MKTYTIEELKKKFNGKWNVIHIETETDYNKLNNYFPNLASFEKPYIYYLTHISNSGKAIKRHTYEYNQYNIIEFSQIDFQEAPEDTLKNIIIW